VQIELREDFVSHRLRNLSGIEKAAVVRRTGMQAGRI
jgi:hypothetical protein